MRSECRQGRTGEASWRSSEVDWRVLLTPQLEGALALLYSGEYLVEFCR